MQSIIIFYTCTVCMHAYICMYTKYLIYFVVILLNKRIITLNVTRLDTVKKVKKEVQNEIEIFNDQLTMFYEEKRLYDDDLMTYHSGSVLEIKFGN